MGVTHQRYRHSSRAGNGSRRAARSAARFHFGAAGLLLAIAALSSEG